MNAMPDKDVAEDVASDWTWAAAHETGALAFVRDHLWQHFVRHSTQGEDVKQATDYVIATPSNIKIAMRVRRISNTKFRRDFTLRLRRRSGVKTEVQKIADGYADLYCYCWINDLLGGDIDEYVIIDMHAFRKAGLLSRPDGSQWTNDGSAEFAWWTLHTLQDAGVIADGVRRPGKAVEFRWVTKTID